MGIVICEDNNEQREKIEEIISNDLSGRNLDSNIVVSTGAPGKVMEYVKRSKGTFIYILDVDLGSSINGIELAKEIRKFDPKGYIVFLTCHSELTLLTFQYKVQALDYIIKDNLQNVRTSIIECIHEAYEDYKRINTLETREITIDLGNKIIKIKLEDILFFETAGKDHKLRVHTSDEQIEFYGTLKEIEKTVDDEYFRVHRAYLVNTKRIEAIDKDKMIAYMDNSETCLISSRCVKGLTKRCLH